MASVKSVMNRMRIMLGSLLPAMWLAASGHYDSGSIGACAGYSCFASLLAAQPGQKLPIQAGCAFRQLVRSASRRLGLPSGGDDVPPFMAAPGLSLPGLRHAQAAHDLPSALFGLANSWQFHWRTALEPRAPSLVS
jgi:hypothetical protein